MAYTTLDMTNNVVDDLKDPSFSTTRVRRYLNAGQRRIFNTHLFKFCEKAVAGDLTVGVNTFEQQDDHQATIGGALVDTDTDNNIVFKLDESTYMPHREFFDQYPTPDLYDNGVPAAWTEFGDQVYFDRPVDKTYEFRQRYYRNPTELTADASVPDVPAEFRDLLETFAIFRAEKFRGNHDIAATWLQEFEDDLESMTMRHGGITQIGVPTMVNYRKRVGSDA